MHTTEQGDFLPTPSLKCIAWNILSDKVPATQSHSLAPPRLRLGACHGFTSNVWFPTVWRKTLCKLCAATAVDIIGGADRGCWRLELWACLGSQVQGGETLLTGSSHTVREPSCPEIMSLFHPPLIYYNTVIFLLMEYLQASSLHLEASLKSFLGGAVVIPWDTKPGSFHHTQHFWLEGIYFRQPHGFATMSAAPSRNVSQEANARTFVTSLLLTVLHQKCPKYYNRMLWATKKEQQHRMWTNCTWDVREGKQSQEDTFHIFLCLLFGVLHDLGLDTKTPYIMHRFYVQVPAKPLDSD